jgi:2-dehydro-3-deoxyglucarate aldolase/4-hydroxy-2-oxoheptanedioate aldolase
MMSNLKTRLKSGESVIGTMISVVDHPDIAKIIKNSGYDFMIIDNEHGSFDYGAVARMCSVTKAIDFPAIIRIPEPRREIVLKYMDMGADGILLPNCDTPEMAKLVIEYSKYAPLGNRGVSLMRGHNSYTVVASAAEYMKKANDETIIMCQIESPTGVQNAEAILGLEGVDSLLIGPNDLSQSYGLMGQFTHPTVVGAMDKVVAAGKAKGKFSGVHFTGSPDMLKPWMEKGMTFNLWSNDVTLIMNCAREGLAKLRGK